MFERLRQNHPLASRVAFVVVPFAAGIAFYAVAETIAPSFPQSIRDAVSENIMGIRRLPVVVSVLGPDPSTTISTSANMSSNANALDEPREVAPLNVLDKRLEEAAETDIDRTDHTASATWNSTMAADEAGGQTPDVGIQDPVPLHQLSESGNVDTKIRGLEALSATSDRFAVRACIEALVDSDAVVRRHAVRALTRANQDMLYREWIDILVHGPASLQEAFDAELPTLQSGLEPIALSDLEAEEATRIERLAALYTLGRIRSETALPLLSGYAWSDDLEVGRTAAAAIAEVRSPTAVSTLAGLTNHYDGDVRWYATNGLGLIQGEDALAILEAVIASGQEPLQEIRALAVNHLGQARDPGSIAPLVEAMRRYPGIRHEAMFALSNITGIQDYAVPYQWREWYKYWSTTPEGIAAVRRRRATPVSQVAAAPPVAPPRIPEPAVQTPVVSEPRPEPEQTAARPAPANPNEQPVSEIGTAPQPATTKPTVAQESPAEVAAAPPSASAENPSGPVIKKVGRGGFGMSDLSPAELMRQGGFAGAKKEE